MKELPPVLPGFYVELMSIHGINLHICYEVKGDGSCRPHSAQEASTGADVNVERLIPILAIFEKIFPNQCDERFQKWIASHVINPV